jgi:hypothetical protein
MYYYFSIDNYGEDPMVRYFLKKYQKCLSVENYIDFDDFDDFDDWNDPILFLIADFCGFDTYVDTFRIVRNYQRWNNKQLETSKVNKRFYMQNIGLPYFFVSFGWKRTDAYSMAYDFYENEEVNIKPKNKGDFGYIFTRNVCPLISLSQWDKTPSYIGLLKDVNKIKKYLSETDGLQIFLDKRSDIAEYMLRNIDRDTKQHIASYTDMKRDELRVFIKFTYKKMILKIFNSSSSIREPIKDKHVNKVFPRKQKSYSYFRKRM